MRFGPYPVKHSPKQAETEPIWPRWLEGWGLIFPSVGAALLAAWLALPQCTMPDYLPMPLVPNPELATARRQLLAEGEAARGRPLPYEIRAVGESMRQLGRFVHGGEPISIDRRNRFREFVRVARLKTKDEQLRQLRAIQAQLFLVALADWQRTGLESVDLIELGGDFIAIATDLGWVVGTAGPERALLLDNDERIALFVTRWTDLVGLSDDDSMRLATVWPLLALRARLRLPLSSLGQRDLHLIERVKGFAPNYPDLLSQGLIYMRIHDRVRAIEALQAHLRQNPDGPYTIRARNHLLYAFEKMTDNGN